MSGYLYGLVGHVLKYFRKGKCDSRINRQSCITPPRGNQKPQTPTQSPEHDVWMTPENFLRKKSPEMEDSRMFYTLNGAGDYIRPFDYGWPEFPDELSDSLRSMAPLRCPTPPRGPRTCLKRSHSLDLRPLHLDLRPPPLHRRHRTEWKPTYDIFHSQSLNVVEEPKRSLSSRIPRQTHRNVSFEDARTFNKKTRCQCSQRQQVAERSQLDLRLERMFRVVSKSKYGGNIIDAASHARWMKAAGVTQDEDAAHFKSFAQRRVVLTVHQYKSALQKMCQDNNLDYWNVLRKMTDVQIGSCDSNSHVSAQSLN